MRAGAVRQVVPFGKDITDLNGPLARIIDTLDAGKVLCITGAGCSTESGIPDYRSPNGSYSVGYKPMTHAQFMRSEAQRKRYWVRAFLSWPSFGSKQQNECHTGLHALQTRGHIEHIITQNVDGLHGREGVTDLHGRLDEVRCMDCGHVSSRAQWHNDTIAHNPELAARLDPSLPLDRSDGDAEVGDGDIDAFKVPPCRECGGLMTKPNVVLFGDTVPHSRVDACYDLVGDAKSVLVCGTSLAVFSSWKFIKRAQERSLPVTIINIGPTRADAIATAKIDVRVGEALPILLQRVGLQEGVLHA